MNRRIKELAEQAGFIVDETGTFHEFAEKTRLDCFANLIVVECACIADDMKSLDVASAIKEHFGVEE